MNADQVVADIQTTLTEKKRKRYSGANARRSVRRPEEILRDVRGLKLRQRVSLVLGDEILREELEDSIKNSTVNGVKKIDTIRAYQDILLPALQPNLLGVGHSTPHSTVLPINDIKGEGTTGFSKRERSLRCKLAAVYRLVDLLGWSETIFNHISVRPENDKNEFLINPFGLLMSEVTAASLVKVDDDGNVLHGGSTDLGINRAGFVLHSTIHKGRPDINCIIHIHTPDAVAVSSMKCGFLRISQESLIVGGVSYHDYYGILIDDAERESILNDLGPENMVMFLRNHGLVVCGKSIEDTLALLTTVMDACVAQVKAVAVGLDNLNIISDEAYNQVQETMKANSSKTIKNEGKRSMTIQEYQFEAHMRNLDAQGYRTGYIYHMPDIFISGQPAKKVPESRVPPNVMSAGTPPHMHYYNYHGPDSMGPGPLKPQTMGRGNSHRARLKWLNQPVVGTQYNKEEKKPEPLPTEIVEENLEDLPEENGHAENGIVENGHVENGIVKNGHAEIDESDVADKPPTELTAEISIEVSEADVAGEEEATPEDGDDKTAVANGNGVVNGTDNLTSPPMSPNVNETTASSNSLNEAGDVGAGGSDGAGEEGKQKKVKKERSFKKTLMKKFNKKSTSQEDKVPPLDEAK